MVAVTLASAAATAESVAVVSVCMTVTTGWLTGSGTGATTGSTTGTTAVVNAVTTASTPSAVCSRVFPTPSRVSPTTPRSPEPREGPAQAARSAERGVGKEDGSQGRYGVEAAVQKKTKKRITR